MNEPTVTLTYDCERCGGTGQVEPTTLSGARNVTYTSGGSCDACLNEPGPAGKIEREATLTQLKQLLQKV
jgi:hypothetical protein